MGEFVGEFEPLDQPVAQLFVGRLAAMAFEPFVQPRNGVRPVGDVKR